MKELLSNTLIASFMNGNGIIPPDVLNEQYRVFTDDLHTLVDEKKPIIQILRRLAVTAVELHALLGHDKVKKKCVQPYHCGKGPRFGKVRTGNHQPSSQASRDNSQHARFLIPFLLVRGIHAK